MLLADLPFTPTATEAEISLAKEFLELPPSTYSSIGNWRTVSKGGAYRDFTGQGCHAAFSTKSKGSTCVALAHPPYITSAHKEDTSLYERWLWEESFASRFVLARGKYGAVVSADIPATLLHNIAIMSRHARELSLSEYHAFFDFLYPKVGGDLAYVLAFNTGYVEFSRRMTQVIGNQGASHRAFPLFDVESLGNFLRGDFGVQLDLDKDKLFSQGHPGMYGGVKYCKNTFTRGWSALDRENNFAEELYLKDEKFKAATEEYRREGEGPVIYHPPNPFTYQVPKQLPHQFTFKEVLEFVLPYMKKEGLIP